MASINCRTCHESISANASPCPKCGEKHPAGQKMKSCIECGAKIGYRKRKCPKCGSQQYKQKEGKSKQNPLPLIMLTLLIIMVGLWLAGDGCNVEDTTNDGVRSAAEAQKRRN